MNRTLSVMFDFHVNSILQSITVNARYAKVPIDVRVAALQFIAEVVEEELDLLTGEPQDDRLVEEADKAGLAAREWKSYSDTGGSGSESDLLRADGSASQEIPGR